MPKKKHVKKNKVVPCADANSHARERIAKQNHKKEVIRKKIEQMMQERRRAMESQEQGKVNTTPEKSE